MAQNFFEHSPLKRLVHPPYSPDISPSDVCPFGKIKSQLIGQEIPDEIGLFEAVSDILNAISAAELHRVFRSWIYWIERVIAAEGDSIGQ
jgi:histone-lysine N-methyltransferase SETMAR